MTTVSKVSIKESERTYEWSQTDETIAIYLPIKNVLMKNIEIFCSDLLLKITAQSIKYFVAIDFMHEIDHKSIKNKFQLVDQKLQVLLTKKVPGKSWQYLEVRGVTR